MQNVIDDPRWLWSGDRQTWYQLGAMDLDEATDRAREAAARLGVEGNLWLAQGGPAYVLILRNEVQV